ncbi:Hypothetical predicted protein [Octopus vulgaris]|uniref:Uncharacterized protein n=1 Tax=Octopus vulgaris TaxID=6645 RepID=A0AA36BM17_OCTVU|nr:Hypothetical predicted protein [Octopus vulgaris]
MDTENEYHSQVIFKMKSFNCTAITSEEPIVNSRGNTADIKRLTKYRVLIRSFLDEYSFKLQQTLWDFIVLA